MFVKNNINNSKSYLLAFMAITIFYFFESAQMSYFNILAPYYLDNHIYSPEQIADLSAAYYYGNVFGLIPVGLILDKLPLRKALLWAIFGSIIGAFLLIVSPDVQLQWIARFICGFFGGAFSFVGGIKVIACICNNRFSLFMGLFIAAGMFGGLICQYPLLIVVAKIGPDGAMAIVASFGVIVGILNLLFLHLPKNHLDTNRSNIYQGTFMQMCSEIVKNVRNWLDCLMIVLLDTPVSIIGTLWGIVLFSGFYHFSSEASSWVVMSLFMGLIIGSPLWGIIADKYTNSKWLVISGASVSGFFVVCLIIIPAENAVLISVLSFGLGLFSSCQTIGFTWLTKNMKPELIGRNSAFNSMIFMGTNGAIKQLGAFFLSASPVVGLSSTSNLLVFILVSMIVTTIYVLIRNTLFRHLN